MEKKERKSAKHIGPKIGIIYRPSAALISKYQHRPEKNPYRSTSKVSHDSLEIILICWFAAQETFLIIINAENSCVASRGRPVVDFTDTDS